MSKHNILKAAAGMVVAFGTLTLANPTEAADDGIARVVCGDSNGARPGGSVYGVYNRPLGCNMRPPSRLHIVRTPSRKACDNMGGRYSPAIRICWDVDY